MMLKKILPWYFLKIINISIFFFINNKLVEKGFLLKMERVLITDYNVFGIIQSFVAVCLIMPILEELGLRSFLTKNQNVVKLGFSFLIVLLLFKILEDFLTIFFWLDVLIRIGLGLIFYYLFFKIQIKLDFMANNLVFFSLLSSLFFAILHIGLNYTSNNIGILLISVIPFFISGLIFCRVRIKYGLLYSIGLHSLYNLTIFMLNLGFR